MTRFLLVLALLLPITAFAQTPCTAALPSIVINPTQLVLDIPVAGVTAVSLRAYPRGAVTTGTPVLSVTIPRATLAPVAGTTTCYTAPMPVITAVPANVEHIFTGHLDSPTTSPWVVSENAFVRQPPVVIPPPPPATCPTRPNEVVVGNLRGIKETVTSATLLKRILELKAAGWTIIGTSGSATVLASCLR